MYEQSLPCWQQYDPCNSYYGCKPVNPVIDPPRPEPEPEPETSHPPPTIPTSTSQLPPITIPTSAPANCTGEVEVTVDEHKFLLSVSTKGLSWPEADAKAVAHGLNWALATLDSRTEAEQVSNKYRESVALSYISGDQAVEREGLQPGKSLGGWEQPGRGRPVGLG